MGPGLDVVFCGINPGLLSAQVGHHFARPGNRFWKALFGSGFTARLYAPEEDARLVEVGIGITNVVARASAGAAELSSEEIKAGGRDLEQRLAAFSPKAVVVLGLGAYRQAFDKKAGLGRQTSTIGGAVVFVLPNPSGLQARYQLPELIERFTDVRVAIRRTDARTTP